MYVMYTILLIFVGLGLMPRLLWRGLHDGLEQVRARLGYGAWRPLSGPATQGCLWFHAASVGEVQGIQPLITALKARFPQMPVVLSTFTPAGLALAQRMVADAAAVFLLPFDFAWSMRRLVHTLNPCVLIVQETELWPHLFRAAAERQVPVVLVNGRLSPRAYRRYLWIRALMQRVLADVRLVLVQSEATGQRFLRLGSPGQCVRVVGHSNIDRALQMAEQAAASHPLAAIAQGKRLLIGGSTHEGEETVLLNVYRRLYAEHPDLLLVLAPRHLERVETVVRYGQASGCCVLRRSRANMGELATCTGPTVLLLDTLGELPRLYQLGTVAFVGGSLVAIGGHNILEPAVFAKPLLFGPHMQHFPELAAMLCQAGGAIQVQGEADLYAQIAHLLTHPEASRVMGECALQALRDNRGALAYTIEAVAGLLQPSIQSCSTAS